MLQYDYCGEAAKVQSKGKILKNIENNDIKQFFNEERINYTGNRVKFNICLTSACGSVT
jgi:hypothetical protein